MTLGKNFKSYSIWAGLIVPIFYIILLATLGYLESGFSHRTDMMSILGGASAVFASLIYLAIQIRGSTNQASAQMFQSATAEQIKEMFHSEYAKRAAKKYLERQNPNLMNSEIFSYLFEPEEANNGPA